MNAFPLRGPRRTLVDTAGKWRQLVPAAKWGHGKPLTELAERWTASPLEEIDALLESHADTRGFVAEEGFAGGEFPLGVSGHAAGGATWLSVLPLADEPLGPTVAEAHAEAARDWAHGGGAPIESAAQRVFNVPYPVIRELSWTLLETASRALREAEARRCAQAVVVAHELRWPLTPRQLAADQVGAVDDFAKRLSQAGEAPPVGQLARMVERAGVRLYLGRALHQR